MGAVDSWNTLACQPAPIHSSAPNKITTPMRTRALHHSATTFAALSQFFQEFFKAQMSTHLWYKSKKPCPCKIKEFLNEGVAGAGRTRPNAFLL